MPRDVIAADGIELALGLERPEATLSLSVSRPAAVWLRFCTCCATDGDRFLGESSSLALHIAGPKVPS